METRKAICQGCYSGPVGHTHTPQYTPKQHRQAQDLAVQLGHLNKGIPSLIDLYAAAPSMFELLENIRLALEAVISGNCEDINHRQVLDDISKTITKAKGK